jgi:hypothetical protein
LYARTEEHKQKIGLAHTGEENINWKGDDVGYYALDTWIRKNRPKPISRLCEICNNKPLRHAANFTGISNSDFKNWKYACYSCHLKLDIGTGRPIGLPHSKSTVLRMGK